MYCKFLLYHPSLILLWWWYICCLLNKYPLSVKISVPLKVWEIKPTLPKDFILQISAALSSLVCISSLASSLSGRDYKGEYGNKWKMQEGRGGELLYFSQVFNRQLMYRGIIPHVHRQPLYVHCVLTSLSAAWQCLHTLITSGVFQGLSVYLPLKHHSSFSLIPSSTTAFHPHTKHKISIFPL